MPPEVDEIVKQAVKDETARRMSKKNLKRLARAIIPELKPSETTSTPPCLSKQNPFDMTGSLPAAVAEVAPQHREKLAPMGDQLNPLIAWYSRVAKPIPRKLWASMPKAQAAIDAEWAKLRACDDGKGTWDESTVCNYWEAQRQAKEKLDRTGVHTHFGSLFDLCVEKASELEESKRRYKGRVVFGGAPDPRRIRIRSSIPGTGQWIVYD